MPSVYVGMVCDLLHEGHINILTIAHAKGDVTVGLLTDEAVESYKRRPIQAWKDRKTIVSAIRYVKDVIPQPTLDYTENLRTLKPDFVVHGNDWVTGPQASARQAVIDCLDEWGGVLIEPAYTDGVSTTSLIEKIKCT